MTSFVFYQDQVLKADKKTLQLIEPIILSRLEIEPEVECIEILNPSQLPALLPFLPLRQALISLPEGLLTQAIKSYFILRWEKNHQYCGGCGRHTTHQKPNFERFCVHCNLSFFPRISPCIIVRINKGEELLMSRSYHFQAGVFGLIAGFIEPGETAEEAVHREVMEETGIKIKNLKYFASQPWPFPDALMLGFTAEYESGKLQIDHQELEIAGWYHYQHLPGRPANPRSLASHLIKDFEDQSSGGV